MGSPGIIILVGLAIFNGMYSPFLTLLFLSRPVWYPEFLPLSNHIIFFLSSLLLSTIYIMLAGLPAVIYQHITRKFLDKDSNEEVMYGIWIAALAMLTIPALQMYMDIG